MSPTDVPPASRDQSSSCAHNSQDASADLNILVAEDHPANRMVIEIMLSGMASVVFAENGQQAVEAARAEVFDLILMDMHMPVLNGVDATRQIRADERAIERKAVPVLMLSANHLD